MELVLPDNPTLPINATGKVTWVRPQLEHYMFFPGMGVQFTDISEEARVRLVELVKSLAQARGVSRTPFLPLGRRSSHTAVGVAEAGAVG